MLIQNTTEIMPSLLMSTSLCFNVSIWGAGDEVLLCKGTICMGKCELFL